MYKYFLSANSNIPTLSNHYSSFLPSPLFSRLTQLPASIDSPSVRWPINVPLSRSKKEEVGIRSIPAVSRVVRFLLAHDLLSPRILWLRSARSTSIMSLIANCFRRLTETPIKNEVNKESHSIRASRTKHAWALFAGCARLMISLCSLFFSSPLLVTHERLIQR